MGFWHEFKQFALKGNVVDMAVGILVGIAFNKVVSSLVNDIFMPPLGLLIGGVEFKHLQWVLKHADPDSGGSEVAVRYGLFINTAVEFLLIAFSVFIVVKAMNRLIALRPPASPQQ